MRKIICMASLLASCLWAQNDERPRISMPEPGRSAAAAVAGGGPDFVLAQLEYDLADKRRDGFEQALPELVGFFQTVDRSGANVTWQRLKMGDRRLGNVDLLYMTGNTGMLVISATEKENLARYLRGGGLLFAEDIRPSGPMQGLQGQGAGVPGTPFDRQFKALIRDREVLGKDGQQWRKVPRDHALYRTPWSFKDGPPLDGAPGGQVVDLEILELRGRAAVLFSELNISWYWGDPLAKERDKGLLFGANLIVFALTQRAGR